MQFYNSTLDIARTTLGFYGLAGVLALALTLAACDSNSDSPPTGTLDVSVSTSGEMIDSDGYTIEVADQSSDVESDGSATFADLEEGPHEVALSGLKANCSVDGANPQPVTILQGDSTSLSFRVTCQSTTGAIEVVTATSGSDTDSDGYVVAVDGGDSTQIGAGASTTFTGLSDGTHEVALSSIESNCSTAGPNPRSVSVAAREITSFRFDVSCQSTTGSVEVSVATSGETPDANGYVVTVDGENSTSVGPNGQITIRNLSAGSHDVALSDRQVNCSVSGDTPKTVSVSGGETTTASFNLTCPRALLDRIVFESNRAGNDDIQTISPNGTDLVQITTHSAHDHSPTVSPDGIRIAFDSDRDGGGRDLYTIRADGTGLTRITTDGASDRSPTWSPDGTRIAFFSNRDGNFEIYTINADGSDPTQITTNGTSDLSPAWSPDGTRLAFLSDRDGGDNDIYTIKPDGSDLTQITTHGGDDGTPAWSPDGTRIAFQSDRDGSDFDIYTINEDGSGSATRLTTNGAFDAVATWSPDGSRIAFGSDRNGNYDIYTIKPDGSGLKRLTTDSAIDDSPSWGPPK